MSPFLSASGVAYLPYEMQSLSISGDHLHPCSALVVDQLTDEQLMTIVFEGHENLNESLIVSSRLLS